MVKILVINLGSTSSKIAIFENKICKCEAVIQHDLAITQLPLLDQESHRIQAIESFIKASDYEFENFDAIACRGGLLKPINGGTYEINQAMYHDLKSFNYGKHASNLSGIIGFKLSKLLNIRAYTVDPVVVDEMMDIARITGIKDIYRRSVFHALNQKAVAAEFANSINKDYNHINVIVAHMGGGITIGAHQKGRVIDVNEGLLGEGPFSPERSGSIPNDLLYQFGYEKKMTPKQMNQFLSKSSGMLSLCDTNDIKLLINRYDQDKKIQLMLDSMLYQVAKAIGERAITLKGQVDQIILTGGMAHSQFITDKISSYTDWISPITVYPGEKEMLALAERVTNVINKQEQPKIYS